MCEMRGEQCVSHPGVVSKMKIGFYPHSAIANWQIATRSRWLLELARQSQVGMEAAARLLCNAQKPKEHDND